MAEERHRRGAVDVKELYVFCEGHTEQAFCNQVLARQLDYLRSVAVHTIRVAFSRKKGVVHRGGVKRYEPLRRDILNKLKGRRDKDVQFTSMLDLYGLPPDFPGKDQHIRDPNNPMKYVEALETAFGQDIGDRRFVPHLQLHEYETLLYADLDAFAYAFENCERAVEQLKEEVKDFPTIEHINDGQQTAPSKRIIRVLPAYQGRKTTAGPDIAEYIGLTKLREKCPHFDEWVKAIEQL
jgi:hypothetical protein